MQDFIIFYLFLFDFSLLILNFCETIVQRHICCGIQLHEFMALRKEYKIKSNTWVPKKILRKRGHSDSHQSKKDSDSHHAATRTHNTEITLFYAARTHTRLAPTTPRPAPNAARTTFAYSLTLRPARLAPAATRTPQRLAPFLWWIR